MAPLIKISFLATLAIVGGEKTEQCQWDSVVDLDGCTGTAISPNVILTAAHCLELDIVSANTKGKKFDIASCEIHPNYKPRKIQDVEYDLAVCVTKEKMDVNFIPVVSVAEFQNWKEYATEDNVYAVGFGDDLNPAPNFKKHLRGGIGYIGDHTFSFGRTKQTICSGDSGGPTFMQMPNFTWRQVGVASFGRKNCEGESYQQRIDVALPWINQMVKKAGNSLSRVKSPVDVMSNSCEKYIKNIDKDLHLTTPPLSGDGFVESETLDNTGCSASGKNKNFFMLLFLFFLGRRKK